MICVVLAGVGCSSDSDSGSAEAEAVDVTATKNTPFQGEGEPVRGGVLRFARPFLPATFTPWIGVGNAELMVQQQIFDELVEATPDFTEIEPALAESWEISEDRRVYTFKLRPGVKFSNGQSLTASDVKFSLDMLRDPKESPNRSVLLAMIESISTPDPSHVRISLKEPFTAFLDYLILMPIVPKSVVEELGPERFGREPVGTGPFMVTSFSPGGTTLELKRNPHYWREGLPYLDGITYRKVADDNARMLAVQSGSIDVADGVPFTQLDRVRSAEGVELLRQNALIADWILINGFDAPLNDPRVRRALVYATPLEQISKTVFDGIAPVAATPYLPVRCLDPSIEPYPYDVEKARELLEQAGTPEFSLTLTIASGDAVTKQIATILQSSWAEAGIDLRIRQTDYDSVINALTKQDFDLAKLTSTDVTSDVAVDDEYAQFFVAPPEPGVFPWTGWENKEARELVEKAASTESEDERCELFSEYQKILHREQPIIGLAFIPNLYAIRSNVHNFVATGEVWPLLDEVWLSE
jgi:peptide/nickel transport system substrate-binding protein